MFRRTREAINNLKPSLKTKLVVYLKIFWYSIILWPSRWTKTYQALRGIGSGQGIILRQVFYAKFFKAFGRDVRIREGVIIGSPEQIELGDNVRLNPGAYLDGRCGGIEIGDRVLIGPYAVIVSSNHCIPNKRGRIFEAGNEGEKIIIGKDSWLGAQASVLSGVNVGEGVVVGAGSVVTKDLGDFTIAAGVPAKVIKERG